MSTERSYSDVGSLRSIVVACLHIWRQPGILVYIPLVLVLAAFAVWAVAIENDFSFYWRDPAAITNTGPWIGLFSNIGVFIWWIAAVVPVFTAIVLWSAPDARVRTWFLLSWGLYTGLLALDDYFMIHEWVVPTYLPVPDNAMYGVYVLLGITLVIRFREQVLATRYPILVLAVLLLGGSVLVDLVALPLAESQGVPIRLVWNLEYVVEDGLKLLGVIAWMHYTSVTSFEQIRRETNDRS